VQHHRPALRKRFSTASMHLIVLAAAALASACQTPAMETPVQETVAAPTQITPRKADDSGQVSATENASNRSAKSRVKITTAPGSSSTRDNSALIATPTPLKIERIRRTGTISSPELTEISGMSASISVPGALFVINDSANSPTLYALNEQGQLLASWPIVAENRDWEDMARFSIADRNYLLVGDTGDNLQLRNCSVLHFVHEPSLIDDTAKLQPATSLNICYSDGPRNVEAFTVIDDDLYLLSKEAPSGSSRNPSGIYRVNLPSDAQQLYNTAELPAIKVGEMPLRNTGIEGALAAAVAGVDLSQPTSMDFDPVSNSVYILTYREVLRVKRHSESSWADAFSAPAELVMSHSLSQAEALTVSPGRAVWFTSENAQAPIWAIPLAPPL